MRKGRYLSSTYLHSSLGKGLLMVTYLKRQRNCNGEGNGNKPLVAAPKKKQQKKINKWRKHAEKEVS